MEGINMNALIAAIGATLLSMIFLVAVGFASGIDFEGDLRSTLLAMAVPGTLGYWLLIAQMSKYQIQLIARPRQRS